MPNVLNYTEQGGAKTVIGGTLEIPGALDLTGATVTGVVTAAVVNNLTTTETGSALDAAQGKALNDKITALGPTNTLVSTSTTSALSAAQGKALKDAIDGMVAANVPQSAEVTNPTVAEFNALLTALKAAGLMVDDED